MSTDLNLLPPEYWFGDDTAARAFRPVPLDPYLRWADLTDFRSLRHGKELPAIFSFIVERTPDSGGWGGLGGISGVSIPQVYGQPLPGGSVSRFATLRVASDNNPERVRERLRQVLMHADVGRVQLGYPRGNPREREATCPPHEGCLRPPERGSSASVVLGVIDDGCAFAHPDLCDDRGHTRLALLWQQSSFDLAQQGNEGDWRPPEQFGYGRALDGTAMTNMMGRHALGVGGDLTNGVDEPGCYAEAFGAFESASVDGVDLRWFKPNRALLTRAAHGTSVLAVAAGRLPNLRALGLPEEVAQPLHGEFGDAASQCPLVFVDLPRENVEISSGRWLPINALDALRFIIGEARVRFRRDDGLPLPVVVNLSSGSTAGAHCGQAMLERAMDELLGADPHLAITLAAGNSRMSESHAQLDVPPGAHADLGLFMPPEHPFDTFVELWLPAGAHRSDLSVTVEAPDGSRLKVTAARPEDCRGASPRDRSAALIFLPQVTQAIDRTMVLLAVCGTRFSDRRNGAAAMGPWRIRVANTGAAALTLQCWVERDEDVFGIRTPQAARFFSFDTDSDRTDALLRRDHTLSNIATGNLVFPTGACLGAGADSEIDDYSGAPFGAIVPRKISGTPPYMPAAGPSLAVQYLPFAARADGGRSHPGVRTAGTRASVNWRMNGTSVAAPQAARSVANEMAAGKSRPMIEEALPAEPAPLRRPPPVFGAEPVFQVDPRDGRRRV